MTSEEICVIPRQRLTITAGWHTGFIPAISGEVLSALHNDSVFVARDIVEYDETLKQVIPYVVIRHVGTKNRYFVYQRLSGSCESRLVGAYSVGVGGHLSRQDAKTGFGKLATVRDLNLSQLDEALRSYGIAPSQSLLRRGLVREIEEEVILPINSTLKPAGVINDESDSVGRVHLGLVFVIEIRGGSIHMRESVGSEVRGDLYSLDQVARLSGQMESWTQLLYDHGLDSL